MVGKRYDFQVPDMTPEQKLNQVQKALWNLIARMVKTIDEHYGEEGLKVLSQGLKNWDNNRASVIKAGLEPGKATPLEVVTKIYAPVDCLLFTMKRKQEIVEDPDENRILYKILDCNVAHLLAKECPKTCAVMAAGIVDGATEAANPDLRVTHGRFLSTGDDACYFHVERPR